LKGEGKAATKDKEIISDEDLKENIIIYTSRPMSFSKTALMFLQSMSQNGDVINILTEN
jgi:hypothetical protein